MVTQGAEHIDIGANPSAEEGEDTLDDSTKQVIDVVSSFQLAPMFEPGKPVFGNMKALAGQLKSMRRNLG